ncbi:hypothetical protein [Sedimentibacter sp.]|uniref:hypothetical protein n=1 Tax=Sedimentibacter sp. TaxID=1960295 RepID=UPI0028AFDB55|nr:hypothetical protein [Sedimentibacter sp.]
MELIFLAAFFGVIVSLILLVISLIRKKPKKKILISLGICFVLFVVGLAGSSPNNNDDLEAQAKDENKVEVNEAENEQTKESELVEVAKVVEVVELNDIEKNLLMKSYGDFTETEQTEFTHILEKYPKLNSEIQTEFKDDIERLKSEKEIWIEEQKQKEWEEFVASNTKGLSAGEHYIGEHIASGVYDVTFNGSGNFIIYGSKGELITNEIGGGDFGVPKYRAILPDEGTINLSGVTATFTPAKQTLLPYQELEVCSGYWIVGRDISNGRYKATALDGGSGNFIIYSDKGSLKTNEILGGDFGVSEVVVNLKDGDFIQISSITRVKFSPEN